MIFIAYYLHWSYDEIMRLEHRERRRICNEISAINRNISGESNNIFAEFM